MKNDTDKNHPQTLDEFLDQIREEAYCKTELGARFERFIKAYLLSDFFGVKFTDVWLWNECPYSHGHDIGIDLVEKVVRVSVESAKLIGQIDGKVEKKSKKMEFVYSTEEDIDSDLPMAAEEAEEWQK